jgi:Type IX secretion system membrane protein PorP/SprF
VGHTASFFFIFEWKCVDLLKMQYFCFSNKQFVKIHPSHRNSLNIKNMKNIFCILICLGIKVLQAQQPVQYSLYFLNPTAFNPAAAGTENSLVFTGGFRQQWTGLDGAPQTQILTVHLRVGGAPHDPSAIAMEHRAKNGGWAFINWRGRWLGANGN